jgi:hypothetical protein
VLTQITCRWICSARSSPYRRGRSTSLGTVRESASSSTRLTLLDLHGAGNPVQDHLDGLGRFDDIASEVDIFIPGHGSVGSGDELRRRIDQDRAYVIALRDGHDPVDARISPEASFGRDFLPGVHARQVRRLLSLRRDDRELLERLGEGPDGSCPPVEGGDVAGPQ